MTHKTIKVRSVCTKTFEHAQTYGLDTLQSRIIAGRVQSTDGLEPIISPSLKSIPAPHLLVDAKQSALRIADAMVRNEHIGLLTDYDVDGITSHALVLEILVKVFGHPSSHIHSYIGHRLQDGYGVSANLTQRILDQDTRPKLIITADCGSSDEERIERLKGAGIDVIVSDHHGVPAAGAPASAYATVNPMRRDCNYPDKAIAGCMVTWLLMAQVRQQLIERGRLPRDAQKLSRWLDLVSLGTVADAVSLKSPVNRGVVDTGLAVMNQKRRACWQSIAQDLGHRDFETQDLAFQIGPRINARGRLADPFAALRFLTAETMLDATSQLETLNQDNQDRRLIEREMLKKARSLKTRSKGFCDIAFDESFHAGVQGIVASRLVDEFGKPAIVLSPGREPGLASGSARSIPNLHIRQCLEQVDMTLPGILRAFGGHAGAAGLTVNISDIDAFSDQLDQVIGVALSGIAPKPELWTDGELDDAEITYSTIDRLDRLQPFGRGFDAPLFAGLFHVHEVRPVGAQGNHLQMTLVSKENTAFKSIWFNAYDPDVEDLPCVVGDVIECAYRLERNDYQGMQRLQLIVEHAQLVSCLVDSLQFSTSNKVCG